MTQVTQVIENTHRNPTQDLAVPWPDHWGFTSEQPFVGGTNGKRRKEPKGLQWDQGAGVSHSLLRDAQARSGSPQHHPAARSWPRPGREQEAFSASAPACLAPGFFYTVACGESSNWRECGVLKKKKKIKKEKKKEGKKRRKNKKTCGIKKKKKKKPLGT